MLIRTIKGVGKGSVKNLTVLKEPSESSMGVGIFEFTDDYSVFDYGKMPDTIDGKGESMARMSAWNFLYLEKNGIRTHFRKFIEPNKIEVSLVRILLPEKDRITTETCNYLIPLEIIFRNSLPPGSSVFRALEKGELTLKDMGLSRMPEPGEKLSTPIIDITTKLELTDRRVKWDEAKRLAALTDKDVSNIRNTALEINRLLTKRAEEVGLEHADGKIELAFDADRNIILVDVCGTLDENRFLLDGVHLSKQVLRDYYKKTGWYRMLEEAKLKGDPKEKWPKPPPADRKLMESVSGMYKAVCEKWTGKKIWNASIEPGKMKA